MPKKNQLSPAKRGPLTNAAVATEDRKIEAKKIKKMRNEKVTETTAVGGDNAEEVVVERESTTTRTISARVLRLHEIPDRSFDFQNFDIPASKLDRNEYDPRIDFSTETEVLVVAPIGRGGNGEVWFAVTPDRKRCCAVKFFFPVSGATERQLAQNELRHWQAVYGKDPVLPRCHLGTAARNHPEDRCYLCMPYISPAPKRTWPMIVRDPFTKPLEEALRRFAASGYKQASMRLEHLGFFPVDGDGDDDDEVDQHLTLYIFDLGRLEALDGTSEESIEKWVAESVRELQSKLPPLSVCNRLPIQREGSFYEHSHTGTGASL